MNTIAEIAWTAGLIDADGCITLVPTKGYRRPILIVDNTDIEIIVELMRLYGGSVIKKKKYKDHHRQAWTWRITSTNAVIRILTELLPYMRCRFKLDHTNLILSTYKLVTKRNGNYSDIERACKEDFEKRFMSCGGRRGSQTILNITA